VRLTVVVRVLIPVVVLVCSIKVVVIVVFIAVVQEGATCHHTAFRLAICCD
jgi:hypothetical protein